MSASNWEICPACLKKAVMAAAAERERVMGLYGTVSVEEFDAARAALKTVDPEDHRTFREDYEFYGAASGTVNASYSGACTACGLRVDFTRSETFWWGQSA
jgi:hypothetical protein